MAGLVLRFEIEFGKKSLSGLLAAAMLVSAAPELGSESLTLTTYYPAPSGIYTKMITTEDTTLARDTGAVTIGAAAVNSNKLAVNGYMTAFKVNAGGYAPTLAMVNSYNLEVGGPNPTNGNGNATIFFHHHGVIAHQLRYNGGTLFLERAGNGYGTTATPNFNVGGSVFAGDTYVSSKANCRMVGYAEGVASCAGGEYVTYTAGVMTKWTTSSGGTDPSGTMLCCPCPAGGCPGL